MDSSPTPAREISNVALLDLTGADGETALQGITRISRVAAILVPERLLARLSTIPMQHVAATVPIPDGARLRILSGQVTLSGDALANEGGDPDSMLVVAGQLVITSPVTRVGYKQLIVLGQVLAPSGSENGLGAGLTRASGQVLYYPYREGASVRVHVGALRIGGPELANPLGSDDDVLVCVGPMVVGGPLERVGFRQLVVLGSLVAPAGSESVLAGRALILSGDLVTYTAPPRMFNGRDSFSGTFFELLPEPVTLVLNGRFVFEDDVQPDGLKQKVAAIVLDGSIVAPRRLVPLLQVLAIARSGSITASDTLA